MREGDTNQAHYASVALSNMKNADVALAELVSRMCDELLLKNHRLLSTLTSLSNFALHAHDLVSTSLDSVIRFVESVLLVAKTKEVNVTHFLTVSKSILILFYSFRQITLSGKLMMTCQNYLNKSWLAYDCWSTI